MKKACALYSSNFGEYTTKILMNSDGYKGLLKFLFDPSLSDTFNKWITNFDNNAIISLYFLPCNILSLFEQRAGGSLNKMSSVNVLDTVIDVSRFTTSNPLLYKVDAFWTINRFYGGSLYVQPKNNSFLDYEPYTKYQLYVPLVGIMDLEANQIVGRYIDIFYTIDFEAMTVTAVVNSRRQGYTTTTEQSDDNFQVGKASAPFGVQIALNGEDRSEQLMNRLSSFGSIVSDIGLAGVTGGLSATKVAGDAVNFIRPARGIETGVSGNGLNSFWDDMIPYLIETKSRCYNNSLKGKPCDIIGQNFLSMKTGDEFTFSGYTEAVQVEYQNNYEDSETPCITPGETEELKSLLSSGVYIQR